MDNEFNYETSLWDNLVLEMVRSGAHISAAIEAADTVIKARRNTFPKETN